MFGFAARIERCQVPCAHYTPRAYVERLLVPTIIEPLRTDWEEALARAQELEGEGKHEAALKTIKDFHHRLCTTRVLDPACGTGNFLYISLELMKRLEGEVLDALEEMRDLSCQRLQVDEIWSFASRVGRAGGRGPQRRGLACFPHLGP